MLSGAPSGDFGYFDWMYGKWSTMWARFGQRPALAGLDFLDFGCGHGAYAVRAAEEGASVVALDTSSTVIAAAGRSRTTGFHR